MMPALARRLTSQSKRISPSIITRGRRSAEIIVVHARRALAK